LGTDADSPPVAEIWLSEEEVEVVTRVVPRERVRVHVNTITESLHVQEALAREVVDVEADETTVDHSTR
jgi:stress response protein YsnF